MHASSLTEVQAEGEQLVLASNSTTMQTAAIRPAQVYGEYDSTSIPVLMSTLRAGRHKTQIGYNTNYVNPTYAGNAARAHILAAEKLLKAASDGKQSDVAGQAFIVTDDEEMRFWDYARTCYAAAGTTVGDKDVTVLSPTVAWWIAFVMEWIAWATSSKPKLTRTVVGYTTMTRTFDISKAKRLLGYRPEVGFKDAMKRSVQVSALSEFQYTCSFLDVVVFRQRKRKTGRGAVLKRGSSSSDQTSSM